MAYAQWLVDYSKANNLVNGYEALDAMVGGLTQILGRRPRTGGKLPRRPYAPWKYAHDLFSTYRKAVEV